MHLGFVPLLREAARLSTLLQSANFASCGGISGTAVLHLSNCMHTVIHLVPYDGIGGVETAARSMRGVKHHSIDFRVNFIFESETDTAKQRRAGFNPFPLFESTRRTFLANPDILIVSLWRSAVIGVFVRLLKPKVKLIVFVHNATDVHFLDYFFTRLAIVCAQEVWADSQSSWGDRFPRFSGKKNRIISFVTRTFTPNLHSAVRPDFIFWGRVTEQKGLDRALRIFVEIWRRVPKARFRIIGPDGGALSAMKRLCNDLGMTGSVAFLGPMKLEEIEIEASGASFYLQTSQFEGMAMAVVEAMQMGLVPVVTPVGEIASYCQDSQNAVIIRCDEEAIEAVIALLSCDSNFQVMRSRAIETWKDKPRYAESMLSACEMALGNDR